MSTVFSKIVDGEIPAHKVYEDDATLAFMDINPIQPGHVTVITKEEYVTFEQLPEGLYTQLMLSVQKVAKKIKTELQPERVGVIIEGFEVPHVHVKVFPINSEAELRAKPSGEQPDHQALSKMAERLRIEEE